jgi:hypothetical protein
MLQLSGQAENRFYGHVDVLAHYCGLDEPIWINGYIQHGWNGCDGFSHYAGHKRISKKFIWSKRAQKDQELLGGKNNFVIGAPWLYNLKMKQISKVSITKDKVIAYPLHSQPWAPKNYLHSEYAQYLKSKFGNVTVSLHWSEFSNEETRNAYQNCGHTIITNGVGTPWLLNFEKNFLTNQANYLANHSIFTTNAMQTSVLYAMSLGLEIDFGGPASWVKKLDETGTYGKYGQQFWIDRVKSDYEETWKTELGQMELKPADELKNVLEIKSGKINLTFLATRTIDLIRDTNLSEKIDYLKNIILRKK